MVLSILFHKICFEKSTVIEEDTLKKICGVFLLFALVFCTAGCGQESDQMEEGTELVEAGEQSPAFLLGKGILLDRLEKD